MTVSTLNHLIHDEISIVVHGAGLLCLMWIVFDGPSGYLGLPLIIDQSSFEMDKMLKLEVEEQNKDTGPNRKI